MARKKGMLGKGQVRHELQSCATLCFPMAQSTSPRQDLELRSTFQQRSHAAVPVIVLEPHIKAAPLPGKFTLQRLPGLRRYKPRAPRNEHAAPQ